MPATGYSIGRGKQVLDAQQGAIAAGQRQEAVDVGMLAGVLACVLGVLGIEFQPFAGCFGGDRAVDLPEVVIDRQRAGLARLVLYRRDNGPNRCRATGLPPDARCAAVV
jgi:hypothetical protein